ncbi:protein sisterless A-like [Musca autumnalis]|uniref:protein sisterless A-like n=1 Tax=Musca autumnalis TaxID=221902 RepID=UPI003CF6EB35
MERINEITTTNRFLEQIYTSLTQKLTFGSLNSVAILTATNPQHIDEIVEFEMKRIQDRCTRKEEQYVEQMFAENPISFERRTTSRVLRRKCGTLLSSEQQQQRTEACCHSPYTNNTIKKAKSEYRHKYMSQKLLQSTQLLKFIKNLIAHTEGHLLVQGLSRDRLHQLRCRYGMDGNTKKVID